MPVVDNPDDRDALRALRAAQEDPWVMYLVARREKLPTAGELLQAAAEATLDVSLRFTRDPKWTSHFAEWGSRSFRKVCLRASERDWKKLEVFDRGEGLARGEPVVRALPPRLKSEREKLLVELQALTGEVSALGLDAREMGDAPTLRFALNADAPMGAGKLAAQVGHAVLIAARVLGPRHAAAFEAWMSAGRPAVFARVDRDAWASLRATEEVAVVRDAGLTEVAPGTETVMALAPSAPSGWGELWRALPRV